MLTAVEQRESEDYRSCKGTVYADLSGNVGYHFCLAQKVSFQGISAVVTRIHWRTVKGELVRSYELSRRKGILCARKKNPHIFGMSIPATVMERAGNCVRVHFHIDPEYESAPNNRYFSYAIESSFIYCMPEVGSQVHIYFPGDDESSAVAVHAVRMSAPAGGRAAGTGYAQVPDNKSVSNVNGAEMLLTPGNAGLYADQEGTACIVLDTAGNAAIVGKNIEVSTQGNISIGEPGSEDGQPAGQAVFEAGTLVFKAGEEESDPGISLAEEAQICAAFIKLEAADTSPAEPSANEIFTQVTAGDEQARADINGDAAMALADKYEEGRSQILHGITKIAATVGTVLVVGALTVLTGGAAALAAPAMIGTVVLGAGVTAFAASDIGEGIDSMEKAQSGDLNRGHNVIRDDLMCGNDKLYEITRTGLDIAFGVVSGAAGGAALKGIKGAKQAIQTIKTVTQVGGNVVHGAIDELIDTGTVDPRGLLVNTGIGLLQGMVGGRITEGILGKLGLTDCSTVKKIAETLVGTGVDTSLDGIVSGLTGQKFDFWDSLARNAFSNALAAIDGLMSIIRDSYQMDPYANTLYLFCGKRADRIKALYHDKTGFVLIYMRLDSGRFQWPGNASQARLLTRQEYRWLMEGLSIDQPRALRASVKRDF